MKFSELQRLQRMEGITVLSADERIEQLEARLRAITKERDALRAMLEDERKEHSYTLRAAKAEAKQVDTLRAKIERMEKQEPVAWAATDETCRIVEALSFNQSRRFDTPLYALPGAKGWDPAMQDALMKFDPATGEERPYPSHANQWRNWHGTTAWLFDPWTGKRRNAYDVGSDVHGLLIAPAGTLGMDMGGGCATTLRASERAASDARVVRVEDPQD